MDNSQGRSQWGTGGANAPEMIGGAPRGRLAHLYGVAVANFLGIHMRSSAAN